MRMGFKLSCFGLGCWLLGNSASIHAAVIDCAYCSAEAYVEQARKAGVGDHLVYDLSTATLRLFRVQCDDVATAARGEPEPMLTIAAACASALQAEAERSPPELRKAFELAVSFYALAGNSRTMVVPVAMRDFPQVHPIVRNGSAVDLAADFNARTMTGNWLRDGYHSTLSESAASVLSAIEGDPLASLFDTGLQVRYDLVLLNGSQARYVWDLHTHDIVLVPADS